MKTLGLFIFSFLIAISVFAQRNKLSKQDLNARYRQDVLGVMEDAYQQGDLESIISVFEKNCVDSSEKKFIRKSFKKVSNAIRADIYEIVIKSYLTLGAYAKSEFFLRKLFALRYNETFSENWLSIRNAQEEKFEINPLFSISFYGGINYNLINPSTRFQVFEYLEANSNINYNKSYNVGNPFNLIGLQLGTSFHFSLNNRWAISTGVEVNDYRYNHQSFYNWEQQQNTQKTTSHFVNYTYLHSNSLIGIKVPFLLRYYQIKTRFFWYGSLGALTNYLLSAQKEISIIEQPGQRENNVTTLYTSSSTSLNKDFKEIFYSQNYGIMGNIGGGYRIAGLAVGIEIQYENYLRNLVDASKRLVLEDLVYKTYDIQDDIKMSSFKINATVVIPLSYKAFKRKKNRQ